MTDVFPGKLITADEYALRHNSDLGYEARLIAARQARTLSFLQAEPAGAVLEIGCGPDLLVAHASTGAGVNYHTWSIVEPARVYAAHAAQRQRLDERLSVFEGYLEDKAMDLLSRSPEGYDTVIASGVVHETSEPEAFIDAAVGVMRRGARILVSVPNALSFHRLLAVKMGLIDCPAALSDRNKKLGQPIVYDPESLKDLLLNAGLVKLDFSGYVFKPFTNSQMIQISEVLGDAVIKGLEKLGEDFPLNAAEICITARRP
jgi:SAM-dependent methyltransferase